jgi:hypothetical protein
MTALQQLKAEFDGEADSFLIQLRVDLHWNRQAFARLVDTMQRYLETERDPEHLPRWVAEGFWFLDHFVRDWTSHPNFPRHFGEDYYEAALERLHDLAYWLFVGESPYESRTLEVFEA